MENLREDGLQTATVIDIGAAQRRQSKPRQQERRPRRGRQRSVPKAEVDQFYYILGERLRHAREDRGWTQHDVEKKTRIDHQAVCRYETARNRIPIHILQQLSALYDKPLGAFIPGEPVS